MKLNELESILTTQLSELNGDVGIYVKYLETGEKYHYNEYKQFWAASVVKIPIALTFVRTAHENGLQLNERTIINAENYVEGSGVLKLLDKHNTLTYKDLLTLMLVVSDNTAANQLIDYVGWESVEKYITELGLKNTTFKHKMMIKAGRGPNLTTAEDMATLLEKMYKDEVLGGKLILEIMQEQLDRTRIPLYIPNDIEMSYKGGSLPEAMHEVGIVYSQKPFLFCFFSDDQKDKRHTNEVLSQCAKYCFEYSNNS